MVRPWLATTGKTNMEGCSMNVAKESDKRNMPVIIVRLDTIDSPTSEDAGLPVVLSGYGKKCGFAVREVCRITWVKICSSCFGKGFSGNLLA